MMAHPEASIDHRVYAEGKNKAQSQYTYGIHSGMTLFSVWDSWCIIKTSLVWAEKQIGLFYGESMIILSVHEISRVLD